jgi:hypothetical protein
MLRARLVSETLRAIAPEIVQGAYTPEEIGDFSDERVPKAPAERQVKKAEVEIEVVDLASPKQAVEAPKKLKAQTAEELNADDLDGDSLMDRIAPQLDKHANHVNGFLRSKGMIGNGTWRDTSIETLEKIGNDLSGFLKAAGVEV